MVTLSDKNVYDVIIIGAGPGGLSAGVYLQSKMPNLKTIILEQNNYPGGYVSGFIRKGIYFDLGAEGIVNFSESSNNQILKEINFEHNFMKIDPIEANYRNNKFLNMYTSKDRLFAEIAEKFPNEKESVKKFLTTCDNINLEIIKNGFVDPKITLRKVLKVIFKCPNLRKYSLMNFAQFLDRFFEDEEVKNLFRFYTMWLGIPSNKITVPIAASIISDIHHGGLQYPEGGMLNFTQKIANHYQKHGGEIRYRAKVAKILIEDKKVQGIQLETNEIIKGKRVVSNADLHKTIFDYTGKQNFSRRYLKKINKIEPSLTGILLFLGIEDLDLSFYPPHFNISSSNNFDTLLESTSKGIFDMETLAIRIPSNINPLIETGKQKSITVLTFAPFDWNKNWQINLKKERKEDYKQLKKELIEQIIARLERVIPNISEHIVVKELATPLTFERYNLVSKGAWYGTKFNQIIGEFKTPIKNLFFAGSNVDGSGVSTAISSGFKTGKFLLKEFTKEKHSVIK